MRCLKLTKGREGVGCAVTTLSDRLTALDACDESVEWAATQTDDAQAWATCKRGDWMLWIAAKVGVDRRIVTLAACACARLSLVHVPEGELRPLHCIETAEAWWGGRGDCRAGVSSSGGSRRSAASR